MHLLLLLKSPLSLQNRVLKLGSSIYMTVVAKEQRLQIYQHPAESTVASLLMWITSNKHDAAADTAMMVNLMAQVM